MLFLFFNCSEDDITTNNDEYKVVIIGNSITKHGITSYWWGDWGMAASEKNRDYVHILKNLLYFRTQKIISIQVANMVGWESDPKNFNITQLAPYFEGDENLIIIRLGENVPNNDSIMTNYEKEFISLIKYIKTKSHNPLIVVTGNFWRNDIKDEKQRNAAIKENCIWVSLSHLDIDENKSTLDTKVFGDDRKWHTISEGGEIAGGVAIHPNDLGMLRIAQTIFKAIPSQ